MLTGDSIKVREGSVKLNHLVWQTMTYLIAIAPVEKIELVDGSGTKTEMTFYQIPEAIERPKQFTEKLVYLGCFKGEHGYLPIDGKDKVIGSQKPFVDDAQNHLDESIWLNQLYPNFEWDEGNHVSFDFPMLRPETKLLHHNQFFDIALHTGMKCDEDKIAFVMQANW